MTDNLYASLLCDKHRDWLDGDLKRATFGGGRVLKSTSRREPFSLQRWIKEPNNGVYD